MLIKTNNDFRECVIGEKIVALGLGGGLPGTVQVLDIESLKDLEYVLFENPGMVKSLGEYLSNFDKITSVVTGNGKAFIGYELPSTGVYENHFYINVPYAILCEYMYDSVA